jgi:carboxylesterase
MAASSPHPLPGTGEGVNQADGGSASPAEQAFFHPAGPTGMLLLHGFSSGPAQMREFGHFLAAVSVTNVGVLLAGHGTNPDDMRCTTWPDWYASVERGYQQLRDYGCQRVFVAGLSLGGTLALHLAAQQPLDGVVLINTPIYLPQFIKGAINLFGGAIPYLNKVFSDVREPVARAAQRGYARTPVECYSSLIDLLTVVRSELPRVTTPALVMYSRNDHVVMTPNSHFIYANLGSRDKRLVVLHRGYHVATVDYDKGDVFARSHDFIVRHGGLGVKALTE